MSDEIPCEQAKSREFRSFCFFCLRKANETSGLRKKPARRSREFFSLKQGKCREFFARSREFCMTSPAAPFPPAVEAPKAGTATNATVGLCPWASREERRRYPGCHLDWTRPCPDDSARRGVRIVYAPLRARSARQRAGVAPDHALKARVKALGSAKPRAAAISAIFLSFMRRLCAASNFASSARPERPGTRSGCE